MSTSTFEIRGVVEGFYGTFYTFPQRDDLIQFLGRHDFNYYVYGPKNDRQHRMRWFEPYPTSIMDDFGRTIERAENAGITFCYAISFGVPIRYASARDFGIVTRKLRGFYDRGCRSFGVFLDDLTNGFVGEENLSAFRTAAEAQATFCNRVLDWLRKYDPGCALMVCPTDYWGRVPFSDYTLELGSRLAGEIEIMYTGPEVCSATLTAADVDAFGSAVGRKPILWDNYPVNDGQMRREMHVGPLRGRDRRLSGSVRGYLSNPMNQAEASKIALVTISDYLRDPTHYRARASWLAALREIGGEDGFEPLKRFAENSLKSPLQSRGAPRMDALVIAVLASLAREEPVAGNRAVRLLSRYFDRIDQTGYELKNRIHNLALRQDLLPWIEALEDRVWMGRAALMVLTALEQGADLTSSVQFLNGLVADVDRSPRDIGGARVRELAGLAQERAATAPKALRPVRAAPAGPCGEQGDAYILSLCPPDGDAPMTASGTA